LKAKLKLEELEEHLKILYAGHGNIAKTLTVKARAFAVLPREMRDAVFEKLYIHENPITVYWTRVGNSTNYNMLKDDALYLSKLHVGPEIAAEAAEVFYKYNTFAFNNAIVNSWLNERWEPHSDWTRPKFEEWFDTDHYGSGMVPRGAVRKISVHLQDSTKFGFDNRTWELPHRTMVRNHLKFESAYYRSGAGTAYQFEHRAQLEYWLNLEGLQELTLAAPVQRENTDQLLRLLSPFVRQLKAKGIKVVIITVGIWGAQVSKDVSEFFDSPSEEDYRRFEESTGRSGVFELDDESDPVAAWWTWSKEKEFDLYDAETVDPGFVRVWLHQHYQVYRFYQRHKTLLEELERIKAEVEWQDAQTRTIRRENYARVVDYMRET
jgi:hypothetical protein